ncbi:MAG TPA: heme ABC exporter ATP-binding protein CcmA [Gemmatimonadaceae bacterium]|nr:heme ABC exporter ATP-binding protein CcmA [Gemmatimonadaceae bacterium]
MHAIDISGLGRRFGIRWVLRGVTLTVRRGEVVGLLGANGSGKSTLLRVVATLLKPNAGTVSVNALDVVRNADGVRAQLGYLAHAAGVYDDLTARENLQFAADMLGVSGSEIPRILERVGLSHVAHDRARGFSAGMQRRLALGRLILRHPSVLLLDEPYANLDIAGVALMNSVMTDIIAAGGTALIALHELAPARAILDRTVTLVDGRIAAELSATEPTVQPTETR